MKANKKRNLISALLISMRPSQWMKNIAIFAAILFAGQLFNNQLLHKTSLGFLVLSMVSSGSYLFNDIIDAPFDRKHPFKKYRPIAAGQLKIKSAGILAFLLVFGGLWLAFSFGGAFFAVILSFTVLHFSYSIWLKKVPPLDILGIATAFILRVLAGEVLTGYHIPIWLMFSVIFLALFIASGKRRSELMKENSEGKTRPALKKYRKDLLDHYLSTFATATLISYALFTFTVEPLDFGGKVFHFLLINYPKTLGRKWLMLSVPFVIIALMRYAQLVFLSDEGERPEKTIHDIYLFLTVLGWGASLILLLYVF